MKFSELSERIDTFYESWRKDPWVMYREDVNAVSNIIGMYYGLTESSFFELDVETVDSTTKVTELLSGLSDKYDTIALAYNDMFAKTNDYDYIHFPRLRGQNLYSYWYLSSSEVEELGSLLQLLKECRIEKDNYLWKSIVRENMNFIISSYICLTSKKPVNASIKYFYPISPIPENLREGVVLYNNSWGSSIKEELIITIFEILAEFKAENITELVENRVLLKNLEFDESNSEISMLAKLQDIL